MPAAYTASQKNAVAQFMNFTSAKDSDAKKYLKASGWTLDAAVEAYFQKAGTTPAVSKTISNLNKTFSDYRDDSTSENSIGAEGTMRYLGDIGVQLEEPAVLAVLTELGAPTMGELDRDPFVAGWERRSADTISKQKAAVTQLRTALTTDTEYFRTVYRYTFLLARTPGQKAVALETALDFWRLLFSDQGVPWKSTGTEWLEIWIEYLEGKWKKSISRDLWNQAEIFARKTMEDETMSWWNEESAWPGVIDDFVGFVKEKRASNGGTEQMVTE